ncbi:hypothetical protein C7T35_07515 [Variovorax sp. WS11]|nr:hypothetical protein C7T35_07515 [Variovorax sp. WS11]
MRCVKAQAGPCARCAASPPWRSYSNTSACPGGTPAFALVKPGRVNYSIVSAVMVNLVLVWSHRDRSLNR